MRAYKLMAVRRDGTLGPLFINRRQVIPIGEWLPAEDHPTVGFARRPGWHCTPTTDTHLAPSAKGHKRRVWAEVEIGEHTTHEYTCRGKVTPWLLANAMRVIRVLDQ